MRLRARPVNVLFPIGALVAWLLATTPIAAWAGGEVSGRFIVTLERAVPTVGAAAPQDLELELDCMEGRMAPRAWGWMPSLPCFEHPAKVISGESIDGRLKAQIEIELVPGAPMCAGGTILASIDLADSPNGWTGDYQLKARPAPTTRAAELWKAAGRRPPVTFAVTLDPAETQSVAEVSRRGQPVRATAILTPLPKSVREGRPRLLFGREDLPALLERTRSPAGRVILARLRELTAAGISGDAGPREKLTCAGFLSAGWAMLARLDNDRRRAADESAKAARQAMVELAEALASQRVEGARTIAGLAVAYDLAGEWWDGGLQVEVATALSRAAARITLIADGAPIGPLDDLSDHRLGCWRSAATLAVLAVEGDKGADPLGEKGHAAAICRRGLSRFISAAIGDAGWGTGGTGYDEVLELLVPAVRALRRAGQPPTTNLAVYLPDPHFAFGGSTCFTTPVRSRGGGLSQVGLYALMAGGRPFDEMPGSDGWLPFVSDAAPAAHRPMLRWRWDRGYSPANPFHATYALLSAPLDVEAVDPAGKLPLSHGDRERGGYILRSGWGEQDFILTCEAASRSDRPAAYRRGHFSLTGLGREWICRPQTPFGSITHVPQTQLNVMRIERSRLSGIGPAWPLYGGRINRVRLSRDGSGSVSLTGYGFHGPMQGRDEQIEDTVAPYPGLARRTVAVDYSRKSGADALLVVVEAPTFVQDREQIFELSVGDLPPDQVKCDNATFTVRPAGGNAAMQGVVLYPATAYATYHPPADGKSGRIAIHRVRPTEGALDTFAQKVEKRINDAFADIDKTVSKPSAKPDDDAEDLGLGTEADVLAALQKLSGAADRLESQHYALLAKMYKHTRSFPQHLKTENKYGGVVSRAATDRRVRARNHWVVIITVGAQVPKVTPMAIEEENLCTVGPQTVSYEEFLVKFGTAPARSMIERAEDHR